MAIRLLILYLYFTVSEIVLGVMVYIVYHSFQADRGNFIYHAIEVPFGVHILRIAYYALPFLVLLFLFTRLLKHISMKRSVLFSVFNTIAFILITLLYKPMDLPSLDMDSTLFWLVLLPIALTPIVVGRIRYIDKLMDSV